MAKKPASYTEAQNVLPIRLRADAGSDYRALVCVFLFGGNDSHNMIVPRSGSPNRAPYDSERGALALAAGTELPLTTNWGVHPSLTNMKNRWDAGQLAVLMNAGVLLEPTSKANRRTARIPPQLYSHNSQQVQWQSLPGFREIPLSGYLGRAHELAGSIYNPSPEFGLLGLWSVAGRVLQMQGWEEGSNDVTTTGAASSNLGTPIGSTMSSGTPSPLQLSRYRQESENLLQRLWAQRIQNAITRQTNISATMPVLGTTPNGRFDAVSTNTLAQQLRTVARIIAGRAAFAHRRDLFFVSLGGWDDHSGLVSAYGPRLTVLDTALQTFWDALGDIGVQQNVITYTASDFGRSLKVNGTGSDHGWGGHHLILGGAVNGGALYGQEPNLTPGTDIDDGQGRLIPTTSVEQYVGALLNWWGIPEQQLGLILPNFDKFTPRTLPNLTREPSAIVGTAPTLDLDFVSMLRNGTWDNRLAFTRGVGPATIFNEAGEMDDVAENHLWNSEAVGLRVPQSFVANSLANDPDTPWLAIPANGITIEFMDRGVENGRTYVDIRFHGTASVLTYPSVHVGQNSNTNRPNASNGQRWVASALLKRLWSRGANAYRPHIGIMGLQAGGTTVSGQESTDAGTLLDRNEAGEFIEYRGITAREFTDALVGKAQLRVWLGGISAGHEVDEAFRIYEPVLKPAGVRFSRLRPPVYVPTFGTTASVFPAANLPRLSYDPVTKVPAMLLERTDTNRIRNSMMVGVVRGVPGTLPTNSGTPSQPTGLNYAVTDFGTEAGMPYMDLRIFGIATAAGSWTWELDPVPAAVTPNTQQRLGASIFARLVAGKLNNITALAIRAAGTVASVPTENFDGSMLGITSAPLSQQRWHGGGQLTNASVDGAEAILVLTPVQNQLVDITLRIACPQLTVTSSGSTTQSSFIPTFGAVLTRPVETLAMTGTNFSSWYNAAAGTLVVEAAAPSREELMGANAFPSAWRMQGATGNDVMRIPLTVATDATNGRRAARFDTGGVSQGDSAVTAAGALTPGPRVASVAASWANPGAYKAALRGQLSTGITPANGYPTLNQVLLDSNSGYVKLRRVRFFNITLTDDQLAAITAS